MLNINYACLYTIPYTIISEHPETKRFGKKLEVNYVGFEGDNFMRLNLSLFILLLSLSASMPAAAEIITIRCHESNSQRGELDLNIVLNTETKCLTSAPMGPNSVIC